MLFQFHGYSVPTPSSDGNYHWKSLMSNQHETTTATNWKSINRFTINIFFFHSRFLLWSHLRTVYITIIPLESSPFEETNFEFDCWNVAQFEWVMDTSREFHLKNDLLLLLWPFHLIKNRIPTEHCFTEIILTNSFISTHHHWQWAQRR